MIETLRDYQKNALTLTGEYLIQHPGKNPCLVMPTGSGKSWVIAGMCEELLSNIPRCKIVVATHSKELVAQNSEKLAIAWPEAPIGIYSAGMNRKDTDKAVIFATIQSIYKHAKKFGTIDLVIVDEAHRINMSKGAMQYRTFLNDVYGMKPDAKVIGLTATPYRIGQGLLTDGKYALFHGLIEPVSILTLTERGFLAPLRSKRTDFSFDPREAHVRTVNGDFSLDDLEVIMNDDTINQHIADECIKCAEAEEANGMPRKHWLFFCCSIAHAEALRGVLQDRGIPTGVIHGKLNRLSRDKVLSDFKGGIIRAITSVDVLTTGFDYPDIDLLAFCRPTKSPGLYVQMAGRGMRPKSHVPDCIVLDFGTNVQRLGPITDVQPPEPQIKKCPECGQECDRKDDKCDKCGHVFTRPCPRCEADVRISLKHCPECGWDMSQKAKPCPECNAINYPDAEVCEECGHEFPDKDECRKKSKNKLTRVDYESDIMGRGGMTMKVDHWAWFVQDKGKGERLMVSFYPKDILGKAVNDYFCLCYDNPGARYYAMKKLRMVLSKIPGADISLPDDCFYEDPEILYGCAEWLNEQPSPDLIRYTRKKSKDGRAVYPNVEDIIYGQIR